ncbi:uncharacterized protein LOC108682952 [Hyalella azteca]|uniref:Uncharacterized protein LOC108682952 n=1 Tax=Hyalella azteca TaxID=294128 RepID=A0A8B7PNC9_HYAAZ|nr:uncharacterized protein LOC108682952 [Hyalella azteca]
MADVFVQQSRSVLQRMAAAQSYQPADFGLQRPGTLPSIAQLEVMCGKDHLTVHLSFSGPFHGLVSSKGQFGNPDCSYVLPNSGGMHFEFQIYYDKCGTKPDMGGKFYENTIIIQYDADLIEVWDEAKRLRCEWYNDYEKTASKPPMVISDLDVIALNFRGDNVDCWMEIQDGKGPWAAPVTGIVPLGSTLTMVIAINDYAGEFDMRTKSCEASDGTGPPIYLTDENGCVLRPKMISNFMKLRNNDGRATVISYAHFHAFKFPDTMYVHLRCKVEICRYGCPDHCQRPIAGNPIGDYSENNEQLLAAGSSQYTTREKLEKLKLISPRESDFSDFSEGDRLTARRSGLRSDERPKAEGARVLLGPRSLRHKRQVVSRHVRAADVGVTTEFNVISEADLEFTPGREEGVTVFQGQREQVIYGICLPAPGFSALFVLLALCTVISVLVAGFMCHHRQLQKDVTESPAYMHQPPQSFAAFNMVHFIRTQLIGQAM